MEHQVQESAFSKLPRGVLGTVKFDRRGDRLSLTLSGFQEQGQVLGMRWEWLICHKEQWPVTGWGYF